MDTEVTFLTALLVEKNRIYIASALDSIEEEPFHSPTRLYHYDAQKKPPWSFHDVSFWTTSLEKFQDSDGIWNLCALSAEGEMEIASRGKTTIETIADAGLYRIGAAGHGYLSSLRNIGNNLYACGVGGQVYKRLGPNQWIHVDDGLLQPVDPDTKDLLLLRTIEGTSENDLYVAGNFPGPSGYEGRVFHWDGMKWHSVELPSCGGINTIFIENKDRVWLAGSKGSLFVGNYQQGFKNLSMKENKQLFHDLNLYKGKIYLGSNFGLFYYDELQNLIIKVTTGLSPDLSYISTVEHIDGVLWAFGPKDIAYFDSKKWKRLQQPHNQPITK